ncbi:MAG: FGGY-family carbohydrate kinase [Clostridia bacterium]|nr:FGGY-family carbohydrate kinase [Clostridia bacterium]
MNSAIRDGQTALGIELGSTRIKAVLIGADHHVLAVGSHTWQDQLVNGVWTYDLDQVWAGLQDCYASLKADVQHRYGETLTKIGVIGISAMMHGYLPFDSKDHLLTPFRTWRNTITGEAASMLTQLFSFNMPQRWSLSHLYQAILNEEDHIKDIRFLTTLAGYVHWQLTGQKVLGIGDASGMMPVDPATCSYDDGMVQKFDALIASKGYPWKLEHLLPQVLVAGEDAGTLTKTGAKLLDPSGDLQPGIPFCPPEGDAGTGMVATNSVAVRTGNVSAGTSIFAMVVLDKPLSKMYPEIDMVTTPSGKPVAMVHCNSCTSDINAWIGLFKEFADMSGGCFTSDMLYNQLFSKALEGDRDCGGIVAFNCYSGEPVTGLEHGCPLMTRQPDAKFSLANFMRANLYSSVAALAIGMGILKNEEVEIHRILGHGGLFKTPFVGQNILAAALDAPVTVMETASEGGAWGIGLLAMYRLHHAEGETLEDYLDSKVFAGMPSKTMTPDHEDVTGFQAWLEKYCAYLPVERAAARL